jgi:hypothetical protein
MGLCRWSLFNSPVIVGLIRTTKINRKNSESHQKGPCNIGSSTDSPVCGRCHMSTEIASHSLCDSDFVVREKFLLNQVIMTTFHYAKLCTLSGVQHYWQNKADGEKIIDQKMVVMQG